MHNCLHEYSPALCAASGMNLPLAATEVEQSAEDKEKPAEEKIEEAIKEAKREVQEAQREIEKARNDAEVRCVTGCNACCETL